ERGLIEVEAAGIGEVLDASGQHPHAPVGPDGSLCLPVEVDERVPQEIAGFAERPRIAEKGRRADGKNRILKELLDLEPRILSLAETDRYVDAVAVEIEEALRNVDPDIASGVRAEKAV